MGIKKSNYDENNLKPYKIVVKFDATNQADAEDFVNDMNPKDWLEHLEENIEEDTLSEWLDTEEIDKCCIALFGHTNWKFVEDEDSHITVKFNVKEDIEDGS
tara:strand:+ start:1413 stop:1718 length:306 start_codon:yes stop_codon:yes gene_type:complete